MGLQTGVTDPRFDTHRCYFESISRVSDVMVIENVPEYSVTIVEAELKKTGCGDWACESAVIDPRVVGIPTARARLYIVAFNKLVARWREDVWSDCN